MLFPPDFLEGLYAVLVNVPLKEEDQQTQSHLLSLETQALLKDEGELARLCNRHGTYFDPAASMHTNYTRYCGMKLYLHQQEQARVEQQAKRRRAQAREVLLMDGDEMQGWEEVREEIVQEKIRVKEEIREKMRVKEEEKEVGEIVESDEEVDMFA